MTDRPSVILLCIDALRADAVEDHVPNGVPWAASGRPQTPAIDAFARAARRWPTAVASSSWTKPSVPSMLLSRHPSEHGVLEVAKRGRGASSPTLPLNVPTLAEVFHDSGYRTAAIAHNAQLDPSLGFDRGFDRFDANAGSGEAIVARIREIDLFGGGTPFFLYAHLIEPHWPFGGRIAERCEEHACGRFAFHRMRAADWKAFKKALRKGEVVPTAEEIVFLRRVYATAVEEADRAVGMILGDLETAGIADETVVLLTADHGEELLDHGVVGHGQSLYEELVRVPFLLRGPIGKVAGDELSGGGLARHVDILPTLLDAAGLDIPEGVTGRSLLAASNGGEPEPAFSEVKHKRRYLQSVHDGRYKLIRTYRFQRRDDGVDREDYNNLGDLFAGRPYRVRLRLFDVAEDPGETRNLAKKLPAIARRLEERLDRWWEELRRRPDPGVGEANDFEEELIRRLESLGYL